MCAETFILSVRSLQSVRCLEAASLQESLNICRVKAVLKYYIVLSILHYQQKRDLLISSALYVTE